MRSRAEIEDSFKELTAPAGQEGTIKLLFELLLDIRELLKEERQDVLLDRFTGAREEVEEARREEIRERLK